MASSVVAEKRFVWKFIDEVTQGVNKARSAMNEAVATAKKAGMDVSEAGTSWTKYGEKAKAAAQETSQAIEKAKSNVEGIRDKTVGAAKEMMHQLELLRGTITRIPTHRTFNLRAKANDTELRTFSRKVHDIPKQINTTISVKDNASGPLKKAENQFKLTKRSFQGLKTVMAGTFVGGAVLSGIYAIGNGLKGLAAAGLNYNREQQTMIASWKTLTGSASEGQKMVDMTNKLAISAQNSTQMVNDLNQKFYAVTNNAGKTRELSKSVLTLQDAFNVSDASIENFSTQWSQMVGNGKASAQDMLSIQNVFPKFRQELLAYERQVHHNKNMTMKDMNDLISQGKISSNEMNHVLISMGHKYQDATKNFTGTLNGMGRVIRSTAPRLAGALTEPFTKLQNPIYKKVSDWVSDKRTEKEFKDFGARLANSFNEAITVVVNLHKAFEPLNKVIFAAISGLASGAWSGFSSTVKGISTTLSTVTGLLTKFVSKLFGIKAGNIILKSTHDTFKTLGTVIGAAAGILGTYKAVMLAVNAVEKTWTAITKAQTVAQTALDVALDANPIGLIVIAIAAVVGILIEAYKHIKPFRDAVNNGFKLLVSAGKKVINFFKNDWKEIALFLVNPIAGGFALAYKHSSKFRSFCHKISKDFESLGKDIKKKSKSIAKTIGDTFTGKASWERDLKKNFSKMMKEYQKNAKQRANLEKKQQRQSEKQWQKHWKNLQKGSSKLWQGFVKNAKNGMKNIQKEHNKWSKNFQKQWNRSWEAIGKFTDRTWQNLKKSSANGMSNMHRSISNGLNNISHIWDNMWNGLKNFFSNIWDGIKQIAQDGMNAVISVINGGIGAIDAVWSFFTGHGSGIKKLGKVHFAQGGTVHRSLSVVNDGPGDDWKELMQFPDGSFGMAQERNWTGFLPAGTRIYSGPETKQIMNMAGIDHYATGGVVGAQHFAGGGIVRALEGWIAKIGDAVSGMDEKFRSMEDYLEAPVQRVKNVVQNAVGSNYGPLGHWGELAHGEWDKITDGMKHWVQHTITQFLYSFEGKSLSRDMMRSAATINKLKPSDGFFNMLWQVIMSESGGRNIVQQVHDVNSGGNEAAGILQYTPGTFAKYALPGHGERMNDFNQLLAFFNNTDWLGSIGSTIIRGVQKLDWLHSGPQGGTRNNFWPMLATGGEVFGTTAAIIGDNPEHHEFVINPYAPSAGPLLSKAAAATANAQGMPASSPSGDSSKLDQAVALLAKLVDLVGDIDPQIIMDMDKLTAGVNKKNAKTLGMVKG